MPDNLDLGPDAQINHLAALLRGQGAEGEIADGVALAPGCRLSIDPDARLQGEFRTGGDGLVDLDYRVETSPRWMALHLAMGGGSFAGRAVIGAVLKSRASAAVSFRICVRSVLHGKFTDCFFDKHVVAHAQTSTHVDLLRLDDHAGRIPEQADTRDLVLFLPVRDTKILIQDLRVFIV